MQALCHSFSASLSRRGASQRTHTVQCTKIFAYCTDGVRIFIFLDALAVKSVASVLLLGFCRYFRKALMTKLNSFTLYHLPRESVKTGRDQIKADRAELFGEL
jgi:hypothetical protein